jgi:hypothetical protein
MAAMFGLALLAPSAHAIGGMASWWQIDETNEDGFGGGLRSKSQIVPMIAIDTRISWINFGDSGTNVFPIEATGLLRLGMLYAGIGMGYYIFDADHVDVDNDFGWYLVGGIDVGVGKFGVFGELKYTMLTTEATDVLPQTGQETFDFKADGFGVNVGVMAGLPGM